MIPFYFKIGVALAILGSFTSLTHTAPVTVINPGFEDISGELISNEFTCDPLKRVGIAFHFEGSADEGEYGMTQTLAETLQANTRYRYRLSVGRLGGGL